MTSEDAGLPEDGEADLEIETAGYWETEIAEGIDPHHDPSLGVVACGRPKGIPQVYLHLGALRDILGHIREGAENEVGGVLLGRRYASGGKLTTEIHDTLVAPTNESGASHVTFSHDAWAAIFQQVDEAAGRSIVGWYHSHPGFGVFLSKQDKFIHEHFFDDKGHVALVLDPVKHDIGLFTWQRGRVAPARGFWIAAPEGELEGARRVADMLSYNPMRGKHRPPGPIKRLLGRMMGRSATR